MGFNDACFRDSEDDMIRTLLDTDHPFIKGITLEQLDREHFVRLRIPEPFQPFAEGKRHFHAETLDYTPPEESRLGPLTAKYPLELISPKNDDSMNSTFGHRGAVDRDTATLHIAREDAAARGIASGDHVRIFNDRGSFTLEANVDGRVRAGVVCAPSVRWPKSSPGRRNVNAVTSERLTDYGGGATFYSCLVQVERIGD